VIIMTEVSVVFSSTGLHKRTPGWNEEIGHGSLIPVLTVTNYQRQSVEITSGCLMVLCFKKHFIV
jgi:hypothetical protein